MTTTPRRRTRRSLAIAALAALTAAPLLAGCGSDSDAGSGDGRPSVVVTYSVLGAVVADVVGDAADVRVLMPNGIDPHEWEPSAKDIAAVQSAALVVENGLGLEEGLQDALDEARDGGVPVFTASEHIDVRIVGEGEGVDPTDDDQAPGAQDPHVWLDPAGMAEVATALAAQLASLGIDVGDRATEVPAALQSLDAEVSGILSVVPDAQRLLVTGHESLGYFARRYGFTLIGAVVPSFSSQAESSAGDLAALTAKIAEAGVPAIFTEIGTSKAVVDVIADETGAAVVELGTHNLPDDGAYSTFMTDIATKVAEALGPTG